MTFFISSQPKVKTASKRPIQKQDPEYGKSLLDAFMNIKFKNNKDISQFPTKGKKQ